MRHRLRQFVAPAGSAILLIAVLSGCGSGQASPAATPRPSPVPTPKPVVTSTPVASGTIKGIAARCDGLFTRAGEALPVTVRVYGWNQRKSRPVATRVTSLRRKSRYSIRLRAGHYWIVAVPSPDKGVNIRLGAGTTRVVNFPNMCL